MQDIQKRAGLGILFLRTGPLVELQASTQARWVSSEKSGLVSWCLDLLPDGEALTKPFSGGTKISDEPFHLCEGKEVWNLTLGLKKVNSSI